MDLGVALAVAAGVEVKHRVEAATPAPLRRAMDAIDEHAEALLGQARLQGGVDLAGPAHALGLQRGVGQHGLGHDLVGPTIGQQIQHAVHPGEVLLDVTRHG